MLGLVSRYTAIVQDLIHPFVFKWTKATIHFYEKYYEYTQPTHSDKLSFVLQRNGFFVLLHLCFVVSIILCQILLVIVNYL